MRYMPIVGVALIVVGILWRLKRPRAPKEVQPRSGDSELAAGLLPSAAVRAALRILNLATHVERPQQKAGPVRPAEANGESGASLFTEKEESARDQALDSAPSMIAQELRRSERILLRIPVQVEGTAADGKLFTERTFTFFVSHHGGSINLRNSFRLNDEITITNLQTRRWCTFRVCNSHPNRPGNMVECGVEFLAPDRNFWGVYFPEKAPQPSPEEKINTMLECATCYSREMVDISLEQYRSIVVQGLLTRDCPKCDAATEWKFGFVEGEREGTFLPTLESETRAVSLPTGVEKRREKRVVLKLPIRIRLQDGRIESTMTENVSRSGACFASNLEMKVGDALFLTFLSGQGAVQEDTPARIMWRRVVSDEGRALYGVMLESHESGAV